MHDHVAGVDQGPVALPQPLDRDVLHALVLQLGNQVVGHRRDLSGRAARCDHHVVADGGLVRQIDGDDVLGLVVVQRLGHQIEKAVSLRGRREVGYGELLSLDAWS